MTFSGPLLGAISPGPFLPEWNFHVLQEIFHLLPHTEARDAVAQFFVGNALASTWIYAAVFYIYWRMEDDRATWRRTHLLAVFIAFCIVIPATLVFRPWIGWPAPTLVPGFKQLYPDYLWSDGDPNCFPSHSTLMYLLIAAGFWPFKKWISGLLMLVALLLISAPRVYVGGHYPIDIIAGILLAALGVWLARRIHAQAWVELWLRKIMSLGIVMETMLFLWVFELGEGFRASYWILTSLGRVARNIVR